MTRTLTRKRRGTDAPISDVQLRESAFSGPSGLKVDREAGVIYGVKIVGLESENNHGMNQAAKGARYTEHALRNAIRLYEGKASNKNHSNPSKANPHDSDPDKRLGWFSNVRFEPGRGLFGDYNVLKSDPFSAKLFEAAERNPGLFAVSHDAYGRGKVQDGWFVIDEIRSVESVDVVADGGTNVSLIESRERKPMKSTFRKLLESSANPAVKAFVGKSHVVRLLEMDGLGDSVLEPMATEEEAAAMGWKEHLGELLKSMASADMPIDEMKKKMMLALKLLEDGDKPEGEVEVAESEEDEDEDKKKDDEKDMKESKKKPADPLDSCLRLCESLDFVPNPQQLRNLLKQPDAETQRWLIGQLKESKTVAKTPKSQGAGIVPLKESKNVNDRSADGKFMPLLRG